MQKPLVSEEGKYLGDSIFVDGQLVRIVIRDSTMCIDSMVFERDKSYKNHLKSFQTYMNGKRVFENISYYKNGNPEQYWFIGDANKESFYRIKYDRSGNIINAEGRLFFQGYVDKIDPQTLEVKDDGKRMEIKVFHPKPPKCTASLFVRMDDDKLYDVFQPNEHIPFLKQVWVDTRVGNKPWSEIDIWFEVQPDGIDTVFRYNKPLFFKVVQ